MLNAKHLQALEAVVAHLVALGRQRIVYVGGPESNLDARERAAAVRNAIERLAPDAEPIVLPGDFTEEAGGEAILRLLTQGTRFDALFAANDMMAVGALLALEAAGLRVPADVAVAGFDDVPIARHVGLTTVKARVAELGARAVERLLAMLEDGVMAPVHELHSTELVVRRSTRMAEDSGR